MKKSDGPKIFKYSADELRKLFLEDGYGMQREGLSGLPYIYDLTGTPKNYRYVGDSAVCELLAEGIVAGGDGYRSGFDLAFTLEAPFALHGITFEMQKAIREYDRVAQSGDADARAKARRHMIKVIQDRIREVVDIVSNRPSEHE